MGTLIAVIGSGGKTTALNTLGVALAGNSVLLTTTTHIRPVDAVPLLLNPNREELLQTLSSPAVICAGTEAAEDKLTALSPALLSEAAQTADFTICEADGSRRLPLKLHRPDEPVLPPRVDCCLVVAGLSALGKPVSQVVHRYDRNPLWAEHPDQTVDVDAFLFCVEETIAAAHLPKAKLRVLLNQADTAEPAAVSVLLERLRRKGYLCNAASLQRDGSFLKNWVI